MLITIRGINAESIQHQNDEADKNAFESLTIQKEITANMM